jgi:hypothetical protein
MRKITLGTTWWLRLRLAPFSVLLGYAAFFCCALIRAHRALWNAAIFLRADGDIVCLTGAETDVFFAATTGSDSFRIFAHRACCAKAIRRREAALMTLDGADTVRVGWVACRDVPVPFSDSMTEIAWSKFSTRNCACLRSARSS